MQKTVFEFEEKRHIIVVDGIEYEIPQRTAAIESKIEELNLKVSEMTEFEGNMGYLEILFGKANAKKMFPDKETTNLDKLAKCTKMSLAAYRATYNSIMNTDFETTAKEVVPVLKQIEKTVKASAKALNETKSRGKARGKR